MTNIFDRCQSLKQKLEADVRALVEMRRPRNTLGPASETDLFRSGRPDDPFEKELQDVLTRGSIELARHEAEKAIQEDGWLRPSAELRIVDSIDSLVSRLWLNTGPPWPPPFKDDPALMGREVIPGLRAKLVEKVRWQAEQIASGMVQGTAESIVPKARASGGQTVPQARMPGKATQSAVPDSKSLVESLTPGPASNHEFGEGGSSVLDSSPSKAFLSEGLHERPVNVMGKTDISIAGPDDLQLTIRVAPNRYAMGIVSRSPIRPARDCYLWSIQNAGLRSLSKIRLQITSARTFDQGQSAFRESVNVGFQPRAIKHLGAGEQSAPAVFVMLDGDNLLLSDTEPVRVLPWPTGDSSAIRRWRLGISVTGLSEPWLIELDLTWTLSTRTLEFNHDRNCSSTWGHAAPESGGQPNETRGPSDNLRNPKRGRQANRARRAAIRAALSKHDRWREHLAEVFAELDAKDVPLGDFYGKRIDLGDGQTQHVEKWEHLDLALRRDRARIIDALRRYVLRVGLLGSNSVFPDLDPISSN